MVIKGNNIMFIKRGHGKIISIIKEDELTDAQKITKDLVINTDKIIKNDNHTDISFTKKSGS